jgi:hypothetical protein
MAAPWRPTQLCDNQRPYFVLNRGYASSRNIENLKPRFCDIGQSVFYDTPGIERIEVVGAKPEMATIPAINNLEIEKTACN